MWESQEPDTIIAIVDGHPGGTRSTSTFHLWEQGGGMITIRQNTAWGLRGARRILLLCIINVLCAVADEPRPAARFTDLTAKTGSRGVRKERPDSPTRQFHNIHVRSGHALVRDLKFTHLTTNDGLSQGYVTAILQDRLGFMWFATRDGLNRYDGNTFIVYKHNPSDPASLSSNFIQDLIEDDDGYLWLATNTGVNRFDPATERFTRYLHDPNNPTSFGGASVKSIAQDSRGYLWFGTEDGGLDKFDPTTGTFTHYLKDSDGQFVGRITDVIADRHWDVWFVGERGLFHLNQQTGQITRTSEMMNGLSAESVCADEAGNLWMLANSPIVGLVKYDRQAQRFAKYPLGAQAVGVTNSNLLADRQNGLWVPSSQGLYYFDRRTERFTYRFQHDESKPDSLDSNAILSVYQDMGGVLWVGTENAGLNILNFRQEQFVRYTHRPADAKSLSPGRVKAIYEEPNGVLWVGFFPRAVNRIDRKTGQITHYLPDENKLGHGKNVQSIYKDAAGFVWVGCGDCGLVRFDERTGRFKHYRHNADDPHSLISDNVYTIYGDRNGQIWVGQQYGIGRFDPATDMFTNYRPVRDNPASLANSVWVIYQDRSGTLWLGTWGGALIRFDDKTETFVTYMPDARDSYRLNGGGITTIHEDRTGTLWVGTFDGLYRYNRQSGAFTRYTESQGLPSSSIRCIQEDGMGKLWLSTQKGISRFDPKLETFRNYDVSDGLQSNEFSDGCYQSPDGEIFFGGSNGFNSFFPENIRDNPYVPPVVITSFKIFNKPVPIGPESALKQAIPYVDSLTLPYRYNVFSLEFAALSYANSQKNRYRYRLEPFQPDWNEVGSSQRLAIYTNLDPGKYTFRVQGSNSDGVWNQEGASLHILITPPWWRTGWFSALVAGSVIALLWAAYQFRVRQLHREFQQGERLRRLEGEIRHLNRVSMMGELTASVAHEVNQPISGVLSNASACLRWLAGDMPNLEEARENARRIVRDGKRAGEIIARIRALATRKAVTNKEKLNLNETIQEVLTLVGDGAKKNGVVIRTEFVDDIAPVSGDRVQLQQVALNLVMNAIEAMSSVQDRARELVVTTRNIDADQVLVTVEDSGPGIDPQVIDKIFDSFYTTKPGGMGMGLSISRSILEAHGGRLWATANRGRGTTFHFSLPKYDQEESNAGVAGT